MSILKGFFVASILLIAFVSAKPECHSLHIHSAVLGDQDVTHVVADLYNKGQRKFEFNEKTWGHKLNGDEVLSVVYEMCGNMAVTTGFGKNAVDLP